MYKFLAKNGQTIAFGIGVLISILFLGSVFSGLEAFNAQGDEDRFTTGIFDLGIIAAIALAVLCAIAAVLFGLMQMFGDLRGSLKGLLGIAALVAIFFIAYSMATAAEPGTVLAGVEEQFKITEGQSKFISGAIFSAAAMAALAAAAFVISEVVGFFK